MSEQQGHQLADISVLLFDISMNRDSQIFAHVCDKLIHRKILIALPYKQSRSVLHSLGGFKLRHEPVAPMYILHISVRSKVPAVMTMKIIYFGG
jgi:hypothetical protein